MLNVILIFTTLYITCTYGFKEFHESLDPRQLQLIFKTDNPKLIPKYTLVDVEHISDNNRRKRSTDRAISINAFDKKIDLYLELTNHYLYGSNTPVYLINGTLRNPSANISNNIYKKIQFPLSDKLRSYQDREKNVAVTEYEDEEGNLYYNGMIGHDMTIQPLKELTEKQKHIIIMNEKNSSLKSPYESRQIIEYSNAWVMNRSEMSQVSESLRSKRFSDSETVYVQILTTMDYETYDTIFQRSINDIAIYYVTFWNAVDLRYRQFSSPSIRLNIAGIVIPQNPAASKYLSHNSDYDTILRNMGEQLIRDFPHLPYQTYDAAIAFIQGQYLPTKKRSFMEQLSFKIDVVAGLAYVHSVCSTSFGVSNGIMIDNGAFDGVTTAAHELGHILGLKHDEDKHSSPQNSHSSCSNTESPHIMAPKYSYPKPTTHHWSRCSIDQMSRIFRHDTHFCLYNQPPIGRPYPKILPGELMSRDEQCQRIFGKSYKQHKGKAKDCTTLTCQRKFVYIIPWSETSHSPLAEGSSCGDGKICLNGECVTKVL